MGKIRPLLATASIVLLLASPALAKKAPVKVGEAKPAPPPAGSTTVKNVPPDVAAPVKQYFEGLRTQNWKAVAQSMHTDALKELQLALLGVAEVDKGGEKLQQLLGKKLTAAQVRKLSPAAAFVQLMTSLTSQGGPSLAALASGTQTEVIGGVPEEGRLHVVLRQRVTFQGKSQERVAVLTFQHEGKAWRAMLSYDMQMFVAQLKMQAGNK